MLNKISAVQKTNEKSNFVIKKLMDSGHFADENKAFSVLRGVMKALRDRLVPGEAIDLGTQLPALLRGFYFEGWTMKNESKTRTKEGFLEDIRIQLKGGHEDLSFEMVSVVLGVILDVIDQGEAIEVLHQLSREIQDLCPDSSQLT